MNIATTYREAVRCIETLSCFMSRSQLQVLRDALKGGEGEWFADKLRELAARVQAMPATHGTDGQDDPDAVLHYFVGACDWYIVEKDREREQLQAFGWADLGDGFGELGYISIEHITAAGAELDLHFGPLALSKVKELRA
jgi:hypothetical protein